MTAKTMAEVLAEHSNLEWSFEYGGFICSKCGWQETYALPYQRDAEGGARTAHQSAALSAAGFGLVTDAKAEALEEAAAIFAGRLPNGTGNGRAYNSYQVADMLRARAAAIRATP